jgi:hypothetical protein
VPLFMSSGRIPAGDAKHADDGRRNHSGLPVLVARGLQATSGEIAATHG